MNLREELIDFLNKENKLCNITMYCNAYELVDKFLKSINSASNESLSVRENVGEKKKFFTCELKGKCPHENLSCFECNHFK